MPSVVSQCPLELIHSCSDRQYSHFILSKQTGGHRVYAEGYSGMGYNNRVKCQENGSLNMGADRPNCFSQMVHNGPLLETVFLPSVGVPEVDHGEQKICEILLSSRNRKWFYRGYISAVLATNPIL